jgi:2-hydroxychromene-2-carboxylate isomerase
MDHSLSVYIDFKSPYAYLALAPTRHLARELNIAVNWLPFVLDIPSYLGSAKLDQSGQVAEQTRSPAQWSGVKYAYYDCRRYANLRNLTIRGTVKIWDSNLAAIGMLWAREQGDEILQNYIDGIYVPFWRRELNIESLEEVMRVLAESGATVNGFDQFARNRGAEQNRSLQETSFGRGIFGVPTYLVGDDFYFGREHLPRIRWLLEGGQGPAPDVAYELLPSDSVAPATGRSLAVGISLDEPESYLAIRQVMALVSDFDLDLSWYALPPKEREKAPQATDQSRSALHRRFRQDNQARDRRRYCAGLPRGSDIAAATAALLEQYAIKLEASGSAAAWASAGYVSSPVFRLGEELFVGRQHLPLIRARLSQSGR